MVAGYGLIPELPCHIWHGNLMNFNQCVDTLFQSKVQPSGGQHLTLNKQKETLLQRARLTEFDFRKLFG